MTPSILLSIILFISAYSPLFLMLIIKDFNFTECKFEHNYAISFLAIIIVGSLISLYKTIQVLEQGGNFGENHLRIDNVKNVSNEFFNYAFPYLLLMFGNKLDNVADIISLLLFLLLLMFLTISAKMVFINPILSFFKYSLYEIEASQNQLGPKFTIYALTKETLHYNDVLPYVDFSRYMIFIPKRKK